MIQKINRNTWIGWILLLLGITGTLVQNHLQDMLQSTFSATLFLENDGIFWISFFDFFVALPFLCGFALIVKKALSHVVPYHKAWFVLGMICMFVVAILLFWAMVSYYAFNELLFMKLWYAMSGNVHLFTMIKYVLFMLISYACLSYPSGNACDKYKKSSVLCSFFYILYILAKTSKSCFSLS